MIITNYNPSKTQATLGHQSALYVMYCTRDRRLKRMNLRGPPHFRKKQSGRERERERERMRMGMGMGMRMGLEMRMGMGID